MIFGRPHRLLQPVQIVRPVGALHLDRLLHRPWTVDIVHDGDVRPGARARRLHRIDPMLVQLDVLESAADHLAANPPDRVRVAIAHQARVGPHLLASPTAAEQVAQWQVGALAGDVPQRDIDGGVRVYDWPIATEDVEGLGRLAMQGVDIGRVLADEPGTHMRLQRRLGRGNDGVPETFAPAGDAGVRFHLDEEMIHGGKPQAGEFLLRGAHVEGNADVVRVDGRNLHGVPHELRNCRTWMLPGPAQNSIGALLHRLARATIPSRRGNSFMYSSPRRNVHD